MGVGDVLIGPDATGTDTYEQNRNLVLTEGTRADSIPNLEIQTGDIVGAGHASATGRFDDEQLFYLQARGITEEEARRLVVFGFLAEVVQRTGSPTLSRPPRPRSRPSSQEAAHDREQECARWADLEDQQGVPCGDRRCRDLRGQGRPAGDVHAIGDTCTHGDISLAEGFVEDGAVECWAHGSMFSLQTGKPLSLPATSRSQSSSST